MTNLPDAQEHSPLLRGNSDTMNVRNRETRLYSLASQAGIILFTVLVWSVLLTTPWSLFSYHPAGMSILVVAVTEGIYLLQPRYTPQEKQEGLQYHALLQILGYASAVLGATAIFYNKAIHDKPHITSTHASFGVLTLSYLLVQLLFGVFIAYVPSAFGGTSQAKALWKYHRVSGYVVLALVWITAQLGAHAEFMVNNFPVPSLMWLYWISLTLVAVGIIKKTDVNKWGLKGRRP
ncbi:eukaryotic cytochrome b561-domain-containing protein [Umbelopsis sp. PMI_123]|nr:eukaryotic cytochrome b561-domain-containing protein [Umbelopsis sp. PMI_123]